MTCEATEFALYIDESGSPKPNLKDATTYFAVGGVLVKRQDEAKIEALISTFKQRWDIPLATALHGNEIRSQKKNFSWLGKLSGDERKEFLDDLTDTLIQCPIIAHACVVSRHGYLKRYHAQYGKDTWEMMKSAFSILLERVSKYVYQNDGKLMVYFEKVGKTEDRLLKQYFKELCQAGAPFNPETSAQYKPLPATGLCQIVSGLEGATKRNVILQVADLCLYPIARAREQSDNLALQALKKNKCLIDEILLEEEIPVMGVKYYCF